MTEAEKIEMAPAQEDHFDVKVGVMLSIFASILAIMQLAGSYSEFGMKYAQAEKANTYAWYNSKSIKQSLLEGQHDMLASLLQAGVIGGGHVVATTAYVGKLQEKVDRYEREKEEILQGSAAVGEKNWVQEQDGQKGLVKGAKEWEAESDAYGDVMSIFDFGNLILQICLVIGAISLVVRTPASRQRFYRSAIALGMAGTVMGLYGLVRYLMV